MEKIHLVMPMGGGGTRFGNEGFSLPKPLIELQERPFFYWAAQSILKFTDVCDVIFVVQKDHIEQFAIDQIIRQLYPNAIIHTIPHLLNGAVLTCLEGVKEIADGLPILFNDCDHAFCCSSFYEFCRKANFSSIDGALLTFPSDSRKFSYVKLDAQGTVIGTVEKEPVSHEAICGAYYFRNKELFLEAAQSYRTNCTYEEYFMSGIYNEMAAKKQTIRTFQTDLHISFGTPEEYKAAVLDNRLQALLDEGRSNAI